MTAVGVKFGGSTLSTQYVHVVQVQGKRGVGVVVGSGIKLRLTQRVIFGQTRQSAMVLEPGENRILGATGLPRAATGCLGSPSQVHTHTHVRPESRRSDP